MIATGSKANWIDWLSLIPLVVCAVCLPQCHLDQALQNPNREEKFVTVHLNDSLKRYDSVDVAILVAGDTSKVVGLMWSGKLPDPSAVPSYKLNDDEDRTLAIRVRAFDSKGVLVLDMLISKDAGKQSIVDLPLPSRPDTVHPDTSHPIDTTRPPDPGRPVPLDSLFPGWKHRRIIDIDIGSLGFAQGVGVRNFPLLVRLTGDDFDFSEAGGSGQDLRFADRSGKSLAYEISRWESAVGRKSTGTAEIWVRLDSLIAGSDSAGIVMAWGNSGATSESDGSKVFPPSDGYGTVLHLSEQGNGTASEFRDATGKNPGTGGTGDGKNVPKRIDGVVGYGQDFHPAGLLGGLLNIFPSDQGTINLPSDFDPGMQTWTFQLWVKRTANPGGVTLIPGSLPDYSGGTIFQKGDAWVASKQRFQVKCRNKLDGQVSIEREGAENITNAIVSSTQFVDLGVVYSGSRIDLYVDGVLKDTQSWTQGGEPNCRTVLGAVSRNGDDQGFLGAMDEIWIGSAVRSPEWMRVSYENQKTGSRFAQLRSR